jgi:Ala-tRNA(Pro) deacylase
MPVQRLKDFLDKNDIQYILISHSRAYTAAAIGAITHIPGKVIAKTVMVKLDGKLAMVVVPGSRHVNLGALKSALGVNSALLVTEPEFADAFPDCEVGAMPPFGSLYGLQVYVDETLTHDEEIAFNAGSHRELMRMRYKDFEQLENPTVIDVVKKTTAELERMAG